MKIVNKHNDCLNVKRIQGYLITCRENKTFFNGNLVGDGSISFYENDGTIFYYNEGGLYLYEERQFRKVFYKEDISLIIPVINESYLCYKRMSRKEHNLSFYNRDVLKWEITTSDFYNVIGDKYFTVFEKFDETKFSVCNTENETLWRYILPDGFKIFGSVQAIDSVLLFTAYNEGQRNQLVTGLDIETGAVSWQNQYEVTNENKFISAPAFNPKDKLYYGFGHIYQVFDPKTGEIVFEKTFEESAKYNLLPDVNAVYDNKLWFVSGKFEATKFGCINLDTQEIELLQDFPQENDEVFDTPVYHEGKLYLRGKFYNNLYVFE